MPESDLRGTFLPVGIAEVRVRRLIGASAWSHARIRKLGRAPEVDITVFDDEGRIAVELRGFRLQLLEPPRSRGTGASPEEWLYELTWQAAPVDGEASARLSGPAAPGTDSAVYGSGSISISPVSVNRTVGAGADVARAQLLVMTGLFDRPSPMTVDGCKQGGWQLRGFQNQGACVRAFA